MMEKTEIKQAASALMNWFESQDICPADGGLIMSRLIALQLVGKTRDMAELQKAVDIYRLVVLLDIVSFFKKDGK